MSEKPKTEKNESAQNKEAQSRHFIEEVAQEVKEAHDKSKTDPDASICNPELLHKSVLESDSDIAAMYELLLQHKVLRFEDIDLTVQNIEKGVEPLILDFDIESKQEAEQKLKLLSVRGNEIRRSAKQYVTTLSQFYTIKRQQVRLDSEDFKDKMESIDRRRRTAHDGLIESLNVYADCVRWFYEQDLLEGYTLQEWSPGQEIVKTSDESRSVYTFSTRFLNDRTLIQEWAVGANLYRQIIDIEEAQNKSGGAQE